MPWTQRTGQGPGGRVPRTVTGNRHEINIQIGSGGAISNIRATCVCEKLNAPARFDRRQAEEDGYQHMLTFAKQGKPAGKGKK